MSLRSFVNAKFVCAALLGIVAVTLMSYFMVQHLQRRTSAPPSQLHSIAPAFADMELQDVEIWIVHHGTRGEDVYIQATVPGKPNFERLCQLYGFDFGPKDVGPVILEDFTDNCPAFPASANSSSLQSLIATRAKCDGNVLGFYDETAGRMFIQIRR